MMRRSCQRGAALLLAMVILTLVATLAGGMVWQHARAIQVEGSERARLQSAWVLSGAMDWAILILREDLLGDLRTGGGSQPADHLGEPWAVPLAEARLSTFLAADRSGTTVDGDDGPDAFLSGSIVDVQAKWNLRNLIDQNGALNPAQVDVLTRLCDIASTPSGTASQLSAAYLRASSGASGAPMLPQSMDELWWLGVEPPLVAMLAPYITVLPVATPINANTASAEVIAAVVPNMSTSEAQRLVQLRQSAHFKSFAALNAQLSPLQQKGIAQQTIDVNSKYFEVRGRLRLDNHALEEVSIIRRNSPSTIKAIQRARVNLAESPPR